MELPASEFVMTMLKQKKHQDPIQAEARRQQVLQAAADCFRRRGYHGAGMAEISKTAGMSPGHIYNYFASKEAIIEAIIAQNMAEMFSLIEGFANAEGQVIDAMVDGAAHGIDKNLAPAYAALQLEMLSEAARNDKVAALLRHVDASARSQLSALLTGEQGSMQHLAADEVAARIELLCAVFNGFLVRAVLHPQLDQGQLLRMLQPWLRQLLAP
jgi:AcrR family transcriptional regulator